VFDTKALNGCCEPSPTEALFAEYYRRPCRPEETNLFGRHRSIDAASARKKRQGRLAEPVVKLPISFLFALIGLIRD